MAIHKMQNPQLDLSDEKINKDKQSTHATAFAQRIERLEKKETKFPIENLVSDIVSEESKIDLREKELEEAIKNDTGYGLDDFKIKEKEENKNVEEEINVLENRLESLKKRKHKLSATRIFDMAKHKAQNVKPEIKRQNQEAYDEQSFDINQDRQVTNNLQQNKNEDVTAIKPKEKEILKFPKGFLWGTSTSAYQVEGGITNDWSDWEKKRVENKQFKKTKKIAEDYICGQACDSYNRYEEDFDLAVGLNNGVVRLSVEWARIQPKRNTWDIEAIDHYRQVLAAAKKRKLKTVLTLWHWTNPPWIAKGGGWANKKTVDYFLEFVDFIIKELGAQVDYWITLNEPTVHVVNGYINGKFPPGKKSILKARTVFNNLAKAHNLAYDSIHKHFPEAQVSITKLNNYIEPARKWMPLEVVYSQLFNYFANKLFFNKIKNHFDFVGFDYYFHDRIVWYPPFIKNKNKQVTDIGWEIYPEGIYHVLKDLSRFNKPIFIMENGVADESGGIRSQFIKDHLYYVHKAIKEGVDIRGYFYWSLLDNFEWDKGWGPKFGLYKVDRKTFKRTPRPSAEVYRDICKNNRVEI